MAENKDINVWQNSPKLKRTIEIERNKELVYTASPKGTQTSEYIEGYDVLTTMKNTLSTTTDGVHSLIQGCTPYGKDKFILEFNTEDACKRFQNTTFKVQGVVFIPESQNPLKITKIQRDTNIMIHKAPFGMKDVLSPF